MKRSRPTFAHSFAQDRLRGFLKEKPLMEKIEMSHQITQNNEAQQWLKVILTVGLIAALLFLASHAYASDGTEFQAAADKFESWIKGNLGKLAAFIALAVGSIVAAVKKDWSWFFGAIVLSIGMGVLISIVNASFTATI